MILGSSYVGFLRAPFFLFPFSHFLPCQAILDSHFLNYSLNAPPISLLLRNQQRGIAELI